MNDDATPAVIMLGLRGFPGVQGGVETHCEHLCQELVAQGVAVSVIVRASYMRHVTDGSWHGVRYHRVWSPRSRPLEAVLHSFLGVLRAALARPDILHIHAIGPALVAPLARLLGLKVVVTHHGPDYARQKWGYIARRILLLGELAGMKSANAVISISKTIQDHIKSGYWVDAVRIPNGVDLPALEEGADELAVHGLEPSRYVLMVTRLVPEKRHMDALDAFEKACLPGWKLVIVGRSDHPDDYSRSVVLRAGSNPNVVLAGFQTGRALAQLYSHAGFFILPSSHEGLPIALLEALSYGIRVLASDIPPHCEIGLPETSYFTLGDTQAFAERMAALTRAAWTTQDRDRTRQWVSERYHWPDIAKETIEVYQQVV